MARLQDEFLQLKQQRREEEERAASAQTTLQRFEYGDNVIKARFVYQLGEL